MPNQENINKFRQQVVPVWTGNLAREHRMIRA